MLQMQDAILQLPFEVLDTGVAIDMATACLDRIF